VPFVQVVADSQKTAFKRKETSKGQFINDGLWSLAQHPNYGGEILMWAGIFLSASSKFSLPETFLASISPAFVSFLLLNVSGVPLQRRANLRKWGKDPKYLQYLQDTPVLWPFVNFPKVPLR
jgi:steroid 5-alpha reductase family enzyme